jgi:hypothetical protein
MVSGAQIRKREANERAKRRKRVAECVASVVVECPAIFEPALMRETLSQGAGYGTREEAHA